MRDVVRCVWGVSSLGDFLAAVSPRGLVALELGSNRPAMMAALRARLPETEVVDRSDELREVAERAQRAIEAPGVDPGIPLDLRGTAYQLEVWSMLQSIPAGETTSYGALAARLGTRDAREVTAAIASNPVAVLVPCHRVIKKDGSISGYRWGVARKRELLRREWVVSM